MELPQDLKHFKAPDAFRLFTPDESFAICVWLLFVAWVADRVGLLA